MIDERSVYALCDDISDRHAGGSDFDRGMRTAAKHIARAVLALPAPAVLYGGDERRHIICLCPDCASKPAAQSADAVDAVAIARKCGAYVGAGVSFHRHEFDAFVAAISQSAAASKEAKE